MINKINYHERFVPLSMASDAIRIDDADIRIKEQIIQLNLQRDGVKVKFRSFLEKKIKELKRKELDFTSDTSGIKDLRMKCEQLLMKLNKNDSSFPVSLNDIPLEIYNESETEEYRRVYNIKKQEFSSPGEVNAIDPITKFHADIQKRDEFAYGMANQTTIKAIAAGSAATTIPIMLSEVGIISTEMWVLKGTVNAATQVAMNGVEEINVVGVATNAFLNTAASSIVDGYFEYRPFSSGEKVKIGGYNKDMQEVMIDIGTGYFTGKISSSIGGQIEPMAKSYHPMYFLVVTNEAANTVASDKISNCKNINK